MSYEKRIIVKGVRYSIYGRSLNEVRRKAKEKEEQIEAGGYQTNDRITLNKYFKEWIMQKSATTKPATILNYESAYRNNIKPALGHHRVKDIERRQVINMLIRIAQSGRIGAASYTKRLLVSILKSAVADDIISKNVAAGIPDIKDERPPARETIHRELTEAELKTFFSLVKKSIYYNHFRFMLYTGVRAGECCGLQWQDIDWKRNTVHIRRTVTRDEKGCYILGQTTKTKSSRRDIPINQCIMEVLTAQWELYRDTHDTVNVSDLVFPGEHGKLSCNNRLTVVICGAKVKAKRRNIPFVPFGVHAFRDTFASRAIRAGMPPNTLKEILGHTSLSMTMDLYAHVSKEDKMEGMQKLTAINF